MGARWFCNECEKEIWQNVDDSQKKSETVFDMEKRCLCSDCLIKKFTEVSENNKYNMVSE